MVQGRQEDVDQDEVHFDDEDNQLQDEEADLNYWPEEEEEEQVWVWHGNEYRWCSWQRVWWSWTDRAFWSPDSGEAGQW